MSKAERMKKMMTGGFEDGDEAAVAEDDFGGHDKDGDGVLKRSEMPRALRNSFTKMDANRNKEIDEDEFYDFIDGN